jgi:hypothetical protein
VLFARASIVAVFGVSDAFHCYSSNMVVDLADTVPQVQHFLLMMQ